MIRFTQEHKDIREMVASFADHELAPHAEHVDAGPNFPNDAILKLAEIGLLGAGISDRHGGTGGDTLTTAIILEELARGCPATALVGAAHAVASARALERFGSDAQRQKLLPKLASGEALATLAHFEQQGEATMLPPQLTATRSGGEYVLGGEKTQVIAAREAQWIIVSARLAGDGADRDSFALFLIEDSGHAGLERKALRSILGARGAGFGAITFTNCRVPESARLGATLSAADLNSLVMEYALGAAAISVGLARAARDYANEYARKRHAFGGPINRFEALRNYLADAALFTDAAALLVYRAAGEAANGGFARAASMAKVHASDAAYRATKSAVQILGGNGYSREYPVERMYRDAKVLEVVCAPNEFHRAAIADQLIGDKS